MDERRQTQFQRQSYIFKESHEPNTKLTSLSINFTLFMLNEYPYIHFERHIFQTSRISKYMRSSNNWWNRSWRKIPTNYARDAKMWINKSLHVICNCINLSMPGLLLLQQGKSEGFESCDRPTVGKCPIWVKIGDVLYRVTLKFDGWPWKTIGHLSFAVSSFVQHFIAIGEFKLELQSGNTQFGSNLMIFRAVWPWNLTDDLQKQ